MRRTAVPLITALALLSLTGCAAHPGRPAPEAFHIAGELKSTGGGAPRKAHVLLYRLEDGDSKPLLMLPVMADGHFSLAAPGPGDYMLRLTAPGYPRQELYLHLPEQAPELSLQATLSPYEPPEKIQKVRVRGSWGESPRGELEPMQQQPDGTWVLDREATGDSVTYQLLGLTQPPHLVPNAQEEGTELTKEGDYRSRVRTRGGRVHIVFDPRKPLPRATGTSQATFAPPYESLNSINGLHARVENAKDPATLASKKHVGEHDWEFDHGTLPEELMQVLRDTHQPGVVRQLAALDVLDLRAYHLSKHYPGEQGEELAARILRLLPPTSPLWAWSPNGLEEVESLVKESDRAQAMTQFAEHNPDANVQVTALFRLLREAQNRDDAQRVASLTERLRPYAKTNDLAAFATREDPGMKALLGRPVPAFSVPLLDGKGEVSNQSLLGRFYLIDFWATWCAPCRTQIPFLQTAAEKFKGRGNFTLLSVSFDESPEPVQQFRTQKWAMPWTHALVGMDFSSPVAKAFSIQSIPQIVLVDARGQVVAIEADLQGEQLDKTLDALLPVPAH